MNSNNNIWITIAIIFGLLIQLIASFIVITVIIFILLVLDKDYLQGLLNNLIYPGMLLIVTGGVGYIFYEKFKRDLDHSYFKNSKVFEKKIEVIENFFHSISDIQNLVESIKEDLDSERYDDIQEKSLKFLPAIKEMRKFYNESELYISNDDFESIEDVTTITNEFSMCVGEILLDIKAKSIQETSKNLRKKLVLTDLKMVVARKKLAKESKMLLRI